MTKDNLFCSYIKISVVKQIVIIKLREVFGNKDLRKYFQKNYNFNYARMQYFCMQNRCNRLTYLSHFLSFAI